MVSKRVVRTVGALLALVLVFPQVAAALTIRVPRNVLRSAEVAVETSPEDATGTVVLLVDGNVKETLPAVPSSALTFTAVPLKLGDRTVSVALRTRSGVSDATSTVVSSWTDPLPPLLVAPVGGFAAKRSPLVIKAGGSTTGLKVTLNGTVVKRTSVTPNQVVNLGTLTFGKSTNTVSITETNPMTSKTYSFKVKRLDFPWPTCIIVDKSDFKLYWVKNGVLVKSYPIAHGKPSTPTPSAIWRVGAKYYTDPGGVYGPRKMRLFKKVGSTYEYTRYGIHGTNEPWVIGTRASHGCIRMYNKDILELFPQVPMGTMVQTRD